MADRFPKGLHLFVFYQQCLMAIFSVTISAGFFAASHFSTGSSMPGYFNAMLIG
jgi:hypothetical protein